MARVVGYRRVIFLPVHEFDRLVRAGLVKRSNLRPLEGYPSSPAAAEAVAEQYPPFGLVDVVVGDADAPATRGRRNRPAS